MGKDLIHSKYRPDIDGLRAIAILSVVLYHAIRLEGGFIGVDIFFVISGYLISTIIFSNLEDNSFSFIEFYGRRIKRIFPALILVMIAVYTFGWFVLLGDEYKQLGKQITGGAGFISNFILWNESGYFDNAAVTKPLLHLWSLGIEEQFYIIWPLLLWFTWKQHLNLLAITIALAVISFVLNIIYVQADAVATFYSPQTRFWELMIGSILAYIMINNQNLLVNLKQRYTDALSIFGIGLIIIGFIFITEKKYFPGWWALLPTLGTMLIISAGPGAWFNRMILSNRILVWFGLISYPLYLWHWPLLSFAHILEYQRPSFEIRFIAVLISILLAWLTYQFIEKPMRFGSRGKFKTNILLILMIIMGLVGHHCYKSDGFMYRSATTRLILNEGEIGNGLFDKYQSEKFNVCMSLDLQSEATLGCFHSKNNEQIQIAIIGDSHAAHLYPGLAEALKDTNVASYSVEGALPILNNKKFEKIFEYILNNQSMTTIIISAYWSKSFEQIPEGSNMEVELNKTLDRLTKENRLVYITDDIPKFSFSPKKCKYADNIFHKDSCEENSNYFYKEYRDYISILEAVVKNRTNVKLLKTSKYFCDEKTCTMAKDGLLHYRDRTHLNINGSKYLAKNIIAENPEFFD
ncbi:MAG: acyltransferase [Legionellales bacterium]|nr:acyltransferase [Legionellales bacterium]|tara:strand:- start:915 stop:2816 length:1902 start_codon:yes stop_codon:yes gene_type:complete